MKRIEFIAPVEAMRGNLSGKQDLLYPSDNNKAYDGPVGSVNYANNYAPRFVGAKIAKSGKKYFTVRTKTANHLTAASKHAMALLGGAGAIYAAIVRVKSAGSLYAQLQTMYASLQALGLTDSFRKWVTDGIRRALINHDLQATFAGPGGSVGVDNPWAKFTGELNVQVSNTIRTKFWTELVTNARIFTVDGVKAPCLSTDEFQAVIAKNYNILNLTIDGSYIRLGSATGAYLVDEGSGNYAAPGMDAPGKVLLSTTVAPA